MIIYTRHAEEQLKFRDIPKKRVQLTVDKPDFIEKSRENKKIYYKNFGENYLRVILIKEKDMFIIITAHWISPKKIIKIKK